LLLYGISLKELNEVNPTLEATGLKIGQNYTPAQASSPEIAVAAKFTETGNFTAEQTTIAVLPKESKYSIARKYGITVKELRANPTIGTKALRWSK
jgi:LysM repeat protein